MKSFISRKKEKLLVFLLVSLLALPLAYTGCHGKGQIETGTDAGDLTLEAEPVVSIDDQLAELRAEFEARLEELKNEDVPETDDGYVKTLKQLQELDKLKQELDALNEEIEDNEKKYDEIRDEMAEEAVEEAGTPLKTFKLTVIARKNTRFFAPADVGAALASEASEGGGEHTITNAAESLKVGFCNTASYSSEDKNVCEKFQVKSSAKHEDGKIVITDADLEGWEAGKLNMESTRVIKLYDSGVAMEIGAVQIAINGKLFYISPFFNQVAGNNYARKFFVFNQQDDWFGYSHLYNRHKCTSAGRDCYFDLEGQFHSYIYVPPTEGLRADLNTRGSKSDMSMLSAPQGEEYVLWKYQGPGNAFDKSGNCKSRRGRFGFTAPLGGKSGFGPRPQYKYRLNGSLKYGGISRKAYCSGGKDMWLCKVSDFIDLGEAAECFTHHKGDRTFRAGHRDSGPYNMTMADAAPIRGLQGSGDHEEGLFASQDLYVYAPDEREVAILEGEVEVEGEAGSEYAILQESLALVQEGRDALADLPEWSKGYTVDGTLLSVIGEKLGEKIEAYDAVVVDASAEDQEAAAKTAEDKKACLKSEIKKLQDMKHEIEMDSLRATIALRKAELAILKKNVEVKEIELQGLEADAHANAIINALSGLKTDVQNQINIVKAERAAAQITFDAPFGVCTEEGAEPEALIAPVNEESAEEDNEEPPADESEIEDPEEEAQEGEGEEPAEESPSP